MAALAACVATALVSAPAIAHDHEGHVWGRGHDRDDYEGHGWGRGHDRDDEGYRDHEWHGYHHGYEHGDRDWGYYGRPQYSYRCHRDGTTGALIGALAGGLLGNGLA